MCPFAYTAFAVSGIGIPQSGLGYRTPVYHISWVAIVTPTDRPDRNRIFYLRIMLLRCFLDFSVSVGVFVIGLIHISSFSLSIQGMK